MADPQNMEVLRGVDTQAKQVAQAVLVLVVTLRSPKHKYCHSDLFSIYKPRYQGWQKIMAR
jgi:hypothetical protein